MKNLNYSLFKKSLRGWGCIHLHLWPFCTTRLVLRSIPSGNGHWPRSGSWPCMFLSPKTKRQFHQSPRITYHFLLNQLFKVRWYCPECGISHSQLQSCMFLRFFNMYGRSSCKPLHFLCEFQRTLKNH